MPEFYRLVEYFNYTIYLTKLYISLCDDMGQFILVRRYCKIFGCCHPVFLLFDVTKHHVDMKKSFPKSQSISSLGASKRPKKVYKSCVALFQKSLKWDSVVLHAMKPTHNVFRCFATLFSHQVSRIVCLDAAMFGQILSHSVAVGMQWAVLTDEHLWATGMTTFLCQGESRDKRETESLIGRVPLRPWFQRKKLDQGGWDRIYWLGYTIVVYSCL